MPAFKPTVPLSLYDAMAHETGEPFADSYLWGATFEGGKLTPRTTIAYDRLIQNYASRKVLQELKIILAKPKPWGSPGGSTRVLTAKDIKPKENENGP